MVGSKLPKREPVSRQEYTRNFNFNSLSPELPINSLGLCVGDPDLLRPLAPSPARVVCLPL